MPTTAFELIITSCWFYAREQAKAEIEESKKKEIAELKDKVEGMIAVGTVPDDHRSKLERIKEKVVCG